jgi:hypothetical protein
MNQKTPMNLYIINEVLYDYTDGMCVIAAESLPRCEQIFMKEFGWDNDTDYTKQYNEQKQKEFNEARIKVIENVPYEKEEVVSYVCGGS